MTGAGWASTDPMSTAGPDTRVNPPPRWSVVSPLGIRVVFPASISGLPASGSRVGVGPPLLASGPSIGSSRLLLVPVWLPVPVIVRAEADPRNELLAVTVPLARTSGLVTLVLSATTVLVRTRLPVELVLEMPPPPPDDEMFPVIVLSWTVTVPERLARAIPPPAPAALFPSMVLLVIVNPPMVTVPKKLIPPPE